jgi:RNA polymerase sigma-70 factor (sigma-E family)
MAPTNHASAIWARVVLMVTIAMPPEQGMPGRGRGIDGNTGAMAGFIPAAGELTGPDARHTGGCDAIAVDAIIPDTVQAAPAAVLEANQAIVELYYAQYQPLVRLAVGLVRDTQTAEEVVQEAFMALSQRGWQRLRDSEKAAAYLRQSVVNGSRSVLRHRTVVEKKAPKPAPDAPSAEFSALAAIEHEQVLAALRTLPPRQREALALRYYRDLSEADIAKAMGISKGAVKSHTARGIAALRVIMEQEKS